MAIAEASRPLPSAETDTPISREQWRVFWAVFLGWVADAFDFNILAFVLVDIERTFTVDRALAGLLGTVTLVVRIVGAAAGGTVADRYGRRLPLILAIAWFSTFAFASGFATSYALLFACRALFGIGMGAEWAVGMPFLFEHWPTRRRGLASGLLMGGWYWGYLLAAVAFQFIYPRFAGSPDLAWRFMFWLSIVPSVIPLWIRWHLPDSPIWLERKRRLELEAHTRPLTAGATPSLFRIFHRDLLGTTVQTTAVLAAFMCIYYSLTFWYPTFLRDAGRPTLPYLTAFNLGAIGGTAAWGRLSETSLGRRGAVTLTLLVGIMSLPLYLHAAGSLRLTLGAGLMGAFGMGLWGIAPAYATERFPTSVRSVGTGFSYNTAAAVGALMPVVLGAIQDRGIAVVNGMTLAMIASGVLALLLIWLGPETRGRRLADFTDLSTSAANRQRGGPLGSSEVPVPSEPPSS